MTTRPDYGPIPTVSAQIREYLKEHYPCGLMRHGAQTDIAQLFGVTRELVRQQCKKVGIRYMTKEEVRHFYIPRRFCGCGAELPGLQTERCENCRWIPISCDYCGDIFKKLYQEVVAVQWTGKPREHWYCSIACRSDARAEIPREHECPRCDSKYTNGQNLKYHFMMKHTDIWLATRGK